MTGAVADGVRDVLGARATSTVAASETATARRARPTALGWSCTATSNSANESATATGSLARIGGISAAA